MNAIVGIQAGKNQGLSLGVELASENDWQQIRSNGSRLFTVARDRCARDSYRMSWIDEDEDFDFEWKDEDEDEVEGDRVSLSHIRVVATVVFLVLLILGALYFVLRLANAFKQLTS